MNAKYDLVIFGGTVIDPIMNREERCEIGIRDGLIQDVAEELDRSKASQTLDATGMLVIPGLIDMHVHLSNVYHGQYGHKMLALAGVTTGLDMAGPTDEVLATAKKDGAGISVAILDGIRPGYNVKDEDPGEDELEKLIERSHCNGAIGIKLRGGHYPMTPEATARAIRVANEQKAYVAYHAGSTRFGSVVEGALEGINLAAGRALHLAHVNSYCRGTSRPIMEETEDLVNALIANPNITCEAYVSEFNGTTAKCSNGLPESLVTRRSLMTRGFEATEKGMEEALRSGWAYANMPEGGIMTLRTGEKAVEFWRELNTAAFVSFPINPPETRFRFATAKRKDGSFVVDGISTDGGAIPRNVIIQVGLSLVKLNALTMADFIYKTSIRPAHILGLSNKGRLSPGADADITIVDFERQIPRSTIANGKIIMHGGVVCGSGCRVLTTKRGEEHVRSYGLEPNVIDVANSGFYQRLEQVQR
ncbi:D-hydantoinase [Sporomusa rhizae]|uniref:amidohydrolase family protein n=1 Tax=Sporomusa rhizae TaxID=357999 RepID=UPI003529F77F